MRNVLYFLWILFLEISCGIVIAFLYKLLSSLLFDENGFGGNRINEGIYYLVILLPPSIYCWMEQLRLKREGIKSDSVIYLFAGVVYLIGGLVFLLIWTNFYLLGN